MEIGQEPALGARLHKYTREAKGKDRIEVKSMINLVLVKRDLLLLYVGCESSVRNRTRHLRSPCCTVYSQVFRCMD